MSSSPPTPADPVTKANAEQLVGVGCAYVTLRLFTNNYYPNPPDALANLTEPTIPEYAPVTGGDWLGPYIAANGVPYYESPIRRFIVPNGSGSVQAVYGQFITIDTPAPPVVNLAERFDAPWTLQAGADALSLAPQLYLLSLAPAGAQRVGKMTPGLTGILVIQTRRVLASRYARRPTWRGLRRALLQHMQTTLKKISGIDGREVIQSDVQGRIAYLFDSTADVDFAIFTVETYIQAALDERGGY